jgi:hypothetical protein
MNFYQDTMIYLIWPHGLFKSIQTCYAKTFFHMMIGGFLHNKFGLI